MTRAFGRIRVEDGAIVTILDIKRSKLVPWRNLAVVLLELPGEPDQIIRLGMGDKLKVSFDINLVAEATLGSSND